MASNPDDFVSAIDEYLSRQGAVLERFEAAWQGDAPPSVEEFLSAATPRERPPLLRALAAIDLERRLRRGDVVRVEDYAARFPELLASPVGLLDLIETELNARPGHGGAGARAELQARFPEVAARYASNFNAADATLAPDMPTVVRPQLQTPRAAGAPETPATVRPAESGESWGDYDGLKEIGRGGMGIVYRARQISLDRIVALKLALVGSMAAEDERQRFHAEAKAAARLRHPGIVTVYEVGEFDGQPYFSMQYVPGINMAALARRGVSFRQAAELTHKIALAIQYAHEQGIVHRDLKPANVLLADRRGPGPDDTPFEPIVTDFGLARRVEAGAGTLTGQVLGTPAYMPPEQAAGRTRELGPAVDVYALGATLYELLTGNPPFRGESAYQTLRDAIERDPVAPRATRPAVPRDLETICLKCLEKEPARRYASARALADDLGRFLRYEPILAKPAGFGSRAWRWTRRRPALAALGVAVATGMALFVAVALLAGHVQVRNASAELAREVTDLLNRPSLDDEYDAELDRALVELRQVDEEQAEALHRAAFGDARDGGQPGRYIAFLEGRIEQARLSPPEVARLRAAIDRLRTRALPAGERLAAALDESLVQWRAEIELTSPADDWRAVFATAAAEVSIEAPGARRRDADPARPTPLDVASLANQECEVAFVDWQGASLVGLGFGYDEGAQRPGATHELLLFADGEPDPFRAKRTLGAAIAAGGALRVQLRRAGLVATQLTVPAAALKGDPMRLRFRREGTQLAWSIQGGDLSSIDEVFSLAGANGGRICLYWPAGAALGALRVSRPALPPKASLLEQGDFLLAAGRHAEALAFFDKELARSQDAALRREVRYKRAVCLLQSNRASEADLELQTLVNEESALPEPEQRWWAPATCQLWALRVRQDRIPEADGLIAALESRLRFEDLALLAPADAREAIIESYTFTRSKSGFFGVLDLDEHITRLRRATKVLAAMQVPAAQFDHARSLLIEALLVADRLPEAEALLVEVYRRADLAPGDLQAFDFLQIWVLAQQGRPELALEFLDSRLRDEGGQIRPGFAHYLVTRAQLHGHLQMWVEALADLDRYDEVMRGKPPRGTAVAASLVRGFVRQRMGDPARGLPEWRRGFELAAQLGAFDLQDTTMLGSLTGEFKVSHVPRIIGDLPLISGSILNQRVREGLVSDEFFITLLRNMWRSRRALDLAERIQFFKVTYAEMHFLQGALGAQEVLRQAILGESSPDEPFSPELEHELPADVEAMVWDCVSAFIDEFRENRLVEWNLLQVFQTYYNGATNAFFGWNGVRDRLPPKVRGPAAYALGRRLASRGDFSSARDLLATALADAETLAAQDYPHAATLRRVATASLAELPAADGP